MVLAVTKELTWLGQGVALSLGLTTATTATSSLKDQYKTLTELSYEHWCELQDGVLENVNTSLTTRQFEKGFQKLCSGAYAPWKDHLDLENPTTGHASERLGCYHCDVCQSSC